MQHTPVGVIIAQIKQLQSRLIEKMLKQNILMDDVNGAQINIIYQLWNEDNITISELSKRTQLANTSLTTMLDRLESRGQIRKCRSEHNRREVRVQLTDKSRNMQGEANEILKAMHSINFNGFSKDEKIQMYAYLTRMKNNLEQYSQSENK